MKSQKQTSHGASQPTPKPKDKKASAKINAKAATRSKTRAPKQSKTPRGAEKSATGMTDAELMRNLTKDIWPSERQVLFKPERLRYVRKLVKPDGCVFCSALKKGPSAESLLIYENQHAMVVLNKFPYNNGHLLVLPRRHCGDYLTLTEVEHQAIQICVRQAIQALTEAYQPTGFNVGLNLGSAAGAGIPEHMHFHIIPRWSGDTNFFALIAETKVVVETLEQTYLRLLPFFKGI